MVHNPPVEGLAAVVADVVPQVIVIGVYRIAHGFGERVSVGSPLGLIGFKICHGVTDIVI